MLDDTLERDPQLLSDRYALGDVIGRGGMGLVYRAWDSVLQREVAVKVLHRLAMEDEINLLRFTSEAETLARFHHPALVTLHDAATHDAQPYFVMELVEGETLKKRCRREPLSAHEVSRIGACLAEALAHVHDQRVVHRDVKPSNVLLGADGSVKLGDFGVARALDAAERLTGTGLTMGTAGYLSPEQVRGEEIRQASDIYSLGLVLIEALSGRPAYDGDPVVVAVARLNNPPRIDLDIPAALAGLLTEMTAGDPALRPDARQIADRLWAFHDLGDREVPDTVNELVNLPAPILGEPKSPDVGIPYRSPAGTGPAEDGMELLDAEIGLQALLAQPAAGHQHPVGGRHSQAGRPRRPPLRTDPGGLSGRAITGEALPHRRELRVNRRHRHRLAVALSVISLAAGVSGLIAVLPWIG